MEDFIYELLWNLKEAKKSNKILSVEDQRLDMLGEPTLSRLKSLNVDDNFIELYGSFNGQKIDWEANKQRTIGGRMHFLSAEEVIKSWEGYLYEDEDVSVDADIRFFHPFDLISDEAQCGIIIDPKSDIRSIFYNYSGEMDIYSLDLDFKGYLEMALEAKIFSYWPKVLLDIKNNQESIETQKFREEMPKIFMDFDFDKFAEKYSSLRLSR